MANSMKATYSKGNIVPLEPLDIEARRFATFFLDDCQRLFRWAGYHVNQQHFGALAGQ